MLRCPDPVPITRDRDETPRNDVIFKMAAGRGLRAAGTVGYKLQVSSFRFVIEIPSPECTEEEKDIGYSIFDLQSNLGDCHVAIWRSLLAMT